MRPLRVLQACNAGRIVGGTTACAWTATRALPACEHHVWFFSPPDAETLSAFSRCCVHHGPSLTARDVDRLSPDVVLLHNTVRERIAGKWSAPTILYLHSAISRPARADATACCSRWLARRLGMRDRDVLWQGTVKARSPRRRSGGAAARGGRLIVGRLCTPVAQKWPADMVRFYAELARRVPDVDWEFVGCPRRLQPLLHGACGGRAVFYAAGWERRRLLAEWDVLLYSNPALPESFGRTVAEGLRAGCVPVVDRLGGFLEQVPEGVGFLCRGAEEFATALCRLGDAEFRRAMSARAATHGDACFSLARFARELRGWLDRASASMGAPLQKKPRQLGRGRARV